MRNLIIFIFFSALIYGLGFFFKNRYGTSYTFMSYEHSGAYRGLAVLAITFCHVAGSYGVRFLTPLGGIGVAVFLISSGYGLNESFKRRGIDHFWTNKLIRLLVPYITIVFAFLLGLCIGNGGEKHSFPYYWYLDFILFWYILFFAVARIPGLYQKRYWCFGIASALIFLLGRELRAEQAISFILGVWISDHYEIAMKRIPKYSFILPALALGVLLLGLKQVSVLRQLSETLPWYGLQLVMKTSFALAILGLTQRWQRLMNNGILILLGTISLEFYLVHYRSLPILKFGVPGMLLFLVLSFGLSWLLRLETKKVEHFIKR